MVEIVCFILCDFTTIKILKSKYRVSQAPSRFPGRLLGSQNYIFDLFLETSALSQKLQRRMVSKDPSSSNI